MKEEIEHPVFASRFIKRFTHYEQIDDLLLSNLEWNKENEIFAIALLPLTDSIPESRRLIVRVFVANKSDEPQTVVLYYASSTFLSDLQRLEKVSKIETITLEPESVYFRDLRYREPGARQGKHYFQVTLAKKGFHRRLHKQIKKPESKEAILSAHISYNCLREIREYIQIERTNYLGLNSKPYVNPRAIKYWLYYSIFGPRTYFDEGLILQLFKILVSLAGIAGIILSETSYVETPPWSLPVGIIVALFGFFALFSNRGKKHVKLAKELKLTSHKLRASIKHATQTLDENILKRYTATDMHYYYDETSNKLSWKKGANRKYQQLIVSIAEKLNIPLEVKGEVEVEVEETKAKKTKAVEEKKGEEKGIDLGKEVGISLENEVAGVDIPKASTVHFDLHPMVSDTSVKPKVDTIYSESAITDTDSAVTGTDSAIKDVDISIKHDDKPIVTDTEIKHDDSSIVTDTGIGFEDLLDIPKPPKIPKKEDKVKRSVHKKADETAEK